MATLQIDDATYAAWSERAAAAGMTVEEWLQSEFASGPPTGANGSADSRTRLQRFVEFLDRQRPTGAR